MKEFMNEIAECLRISLTSLPTNARFNVIGFGDVIDSLFVDR
jgi:hypothetical protein